MPAESLSRKSDQLPESERINQLKDQLREIWDQLADDDKATMAAELLDNLEEGERQSIREALDTRWPITSESMTGTFALIMITRDDLVQIGVDEEEIDLFNDEKLREMSLDIRNHYVVHGFWEELKYHTTHFIGSLQKPNPK